MLMNVLIPAQMQHVLILVVAISVPVTVITLEMASHVKGIMCSYVNSRLLFH